MKGVKRMHIAGLMLIASTLTACGGGGSGGTDNAGPSGPPGLGDSSGQPAGTQFSLPSTVTIQRVVGADHTDASNATPTCDPGTNAQRANGDEASGVVDVCITLRNDLAAGENPSGAATVNLPAGLIFVAKASSNPAIPPSQNGLLAQAASVSIPEGQTQTYILRLYCLNRSAPSSDRPSFTGDVTTNWEYETAPTVTNYAPLQEITTILAPKLVEFSSAWTVQMAVWDVTETGNGLSAASRANLQGLPNKP